MSLTYRCIDIMSETKDLLDNPDSQAKINAIILAIKRDFPTLTHVGISIPQNTNAEATAARGHAFAIDPATYAARFTSAIHAQGLGVLWRGTDCYFETGGLYGFPQLNLRNGNRYTYLAPTITDNFSTNTIANYLTSQQPSNNWTISNGTLNGPTANGWKNTCFYNTVPPTSNYKPVRMRDVTLTAKVKKVGNQQIIVRGSTDVNFPGYGLQMRDTNILRIERPGLASLGEVSHTWVNGSFYWMKLQATGTTIRGKAWAVDDTNFPNSTDGSENEPGAWELSFTDTTYASGLVGFSGESNFGVFDNMTIVPVKDSNTWIARACDFIQANIAQFQTGDIIAPYPEADAHQSLGNDGEYNSFWVELKYCLDQICANASISCKNGFSSQNFTGCIQGGRSGAMFSVPNMVSIDHYGTSLGLNKRFSSGSAAWQLNISGTNTYTVPTSFTESTNDTCKFIPEKVALNKDIDVYIVNKGTGNWTMTIHNENNQLVQLPDHTNIANQTTTGVVTKTNASLTNNAWNTFSVDWDNPDTDHTYHFHLTSTVADGTVRTTTSGNLNTCAHEQFKYGSTPEALEIDLRKLYLKTGGIPIFWEEWGDYWSLDSSRSSPVRTQQQHIDYLDSIYAAVQRLVNDGIVQGFNYWRYLGGAEKIAADQGGLNFQNLYQGGRLKAFYDANSGTAPPPPSLTISASPSTVSSGGSVNIIYTVSGNVTSCVASASPANAQWTGAQSTVSSTIPIAGITTTTIFTLTATGQGGTTIVNTTVTVDTPPPPPPPPPPPGTGTTRLPNATTRTANAASRSALGAARSVLGGTRLPIGG